MLDWFRRWVANADAVSLMRARADLYERQFRDAFAAQLAAEDRATRWQRRAEMAEALAKDYARQIEVEV